MSEVETAQICHKAGASLYFRASEEMSEEFIRALTLDLGLHFGGFLADGSVKGEIEVFVSRKDHTTDWHFDFMENFTLQLKGSKKWNLKAADVATPLRGCTPHYKSPGTAQQQAKVHRLAKSDWSFPTAEQLQRHVQTVTLHPGSAFYFPAGVYHKVEATEDSISINFSLVSTVGTGRGRRW